MRHAVRSGNGLVVKKMLDTARCRFPTDVANLTGLRASLVVAVRFGRVVIVARFRFPRTHGLRIEGPVRNVNAANAIDECPALQLPWGQPLARVPSPNLLPDLTLADLEREQTLRADRRLDLGVIDQRRGSAESAVLADPLGIEHR